MILHTRYPRLSLTLFFGLFFSRTFVRCSLQQNLPFGAAMMGFTMPFAPEERGPPPCTPEFLASLTEEELTQKVIHVLHAAPCCSSYLAGMSYTTRTRMPSVRSVCS